MDSQGVKCPHEDVSVVQSALGMAAVRASGQGQPSTPASGKDADREKKETVLSFIHSPLLLCPCGSPSICRCPVDAQAPYTRRRPSAHSHTSSRNLSHL